jgi:hypothetical protein
MAFGGVTRNGPSKSGRGDWIRTSDPLRPSVPSCDALHNNSVQSIGWSDFRPCGIQAIRTSGGGTRGALVEPLLARAAESKDGTADALRA